MTAPQLRTSRTILRPWRDADLLPFFQLNSDPLVMEHFPALLTREESDAVAVRIRERLEEHEFGFWALEIPGVTEFAGFVGLSVPRFESHFTPCVEIGWRLHHLYWGKGFATEAATAAMNYGFQAVNLPEIVSFTAIPNLRSQAVMQRLGMKHDPADDFDHPVLSEGHPLQRHVLYRMSRAVWLKSRE